MSASVSPPRPDERAEHLTRLRQAKMARSAHAYVRGSTVRFYEWLESSSGTLPEGPPVWICGDCHVGNLGPLADASGRVAVQIRDLDQTVIGNPAHDLARLGLSLASAARGADLPGVTTARMLEHVIAGYTEALAADPETRELRRRQPRIVRQLLKSAGQRRWRHLAHERIADVTPAIPLGKRFWQLSAAERDDVDALLERPDIAGRLAALHGQPDEALHTIDAAYWVKGCSSLGRLRYAVLVRFGRDGEPCLVDIKEGVTAAAPRSRHARMPRENAERVVAGARALSPYLGERMLAARLGQADAESRSVVIRELMPQDLKIDADQLGRDDAVHIARYLAGVVGHAHGRQLDAADRAAWAAALTRDRSKTLDAPSWLWTSVVDLTGMHERAYLEHCRRYAAA